MARLTAAKRSKMPTKSFAGPGRSFPISDPTHARLAISGATRSERAGNISASQAASIKAAARNKLKGNSGNPDNNSPPRGAGPRPKDNHNPPGPAAPPIESAMGNTGNPGNGRAPIAGKGSRQPADARYDFSAPTPAQGSASGTARAPDRANRASGARGAADGLGHGKGGLALHPSMKGANADGYERDHSSRTR
jgi:hypothetical protein